MKKEKKIQKCSSEEKDWNAWWHRKMAKEAKKRASRAVTNLGDLMKAAGISA